MRMIQSILFGGKTPLKVYQIGRISNNSHLCPQNIIMAAILEKSSPLEVFYQNHKLFPSGRALTSSWGPDTRG